MLGVPWLKGPPSICCLTGFDYLHVQIIIPVVDDAGAHLEPAEQRARDHGSVQAASFTFSLVPTDGPAAE